MTYYHPIELSRWYAPLPTVRYSISFLSIGIFALRTTTSQSFIFILWSVQATACGKRAILELAGGDLRRVLNLLQVHNNNVLDSDRCIYKNVYVQHNTYYMYVDNIDNSRPIWRIQKWIKRPSTSLQELRCRLWLMDCLCVPWMTTSTLHTILS